MTTPFLFPDMLQVDRCLLGMVRRCQELQERAARSDMIASFMTQLTCALVGVDLRDTEALKGLGLPDDLARQMQGIIRGPELPADLAELVTAVRAAPIKLARGPPAAADATATAGHSPARAEDP